MKLYINIVAVVSLLSLIGCQNPKRDPVQISCKSTESKVNGVCKAKTPQKSQAELDAEVAQRQKIQEEALQAELARKKALESEGGDVVAPENVATSDHYAFLVAGYQGAVGNSPLTMKVKFQSADGQVIEVQNATYEYLTNQISGVESMALGQTNSASNLTAKVKLSYQFQGRNCIVEEAINLSSAEKKIAPNCQ